MGINSAVSGGYRAAEVADKRKLAIENADEITLAALRTADPELFVERALAAQSIYQEQVDSTAQNVKVGAAVTAGGAVTTGASLLNPLTAILAIPAGMATIGAAFRTTMEVITLSALKHNKDFHREHLLTRAATAFGTFNEDNGIDGKPATGGMAYDIATRQLVVPKMGPKNP